MPLAAGPLPAEDGVHEHDPAERREQPERTHDQHQRIEHDLIGNEGAEQQDDEEGLRSLETPVGERIAVHGCNGDRDDHARHEDLHRIPEADLDAVAVEPGAGLAPGLHPGLEGDFHRRREDVAHADFRHSLQRCDDHHVERNEIVDRSQTENAIKHDGRRREAAARLGA